MHKYGVKVVHSGRRYTCLSIYLVIFVFALVACQFTISDPSQSATSSQPTTLDAQPPTIEVLNISVCDPSNGPFTTTIDNEYFPLSVGSVLVLEDRRQIERVQITVLPQTELIAGVETRVVEEREWRHDALTEISRNFFTQAPDGTVCYFGEEVDDYRGGTIVGHAGAWRAGEGENKPGIIMPTNPVVGQNYQQEVAPGVAIDAAEHVAIEESFTTDAGTFNDVLLVAETPRSTKRYAPGVGLIYDDGLELTDQ